MIPAITPLYAGLLAIFFVLLSAYVILGRRTGRVSHGDGGDDGLLKRMRLHGNFAEYAPFALLLLLLAELQGAPVWALHLLGLMLLAGRVLHAIGMGVTPQVLILRQVGMILTFGMILLTASACIGHAVF